MTAKELEALYVRACKKRRLRPNQAEGEEWQKWLGELEAADLAAALHRWDADATLDPRGSPKCKWIPAAAELAADVAAVAARRAKARPAMTLDWADWRCQGQPAHRWTAPIASTEASLEWAECPWCGAQAAVIARRGA